MISTVLREGHRASSACRVGPGDDAAVLHDGTAVSTDTLVEGVHWDERLGPDDVGYKAVTVSVSDVASMGARPSWVLLNLSLPPDMDRAWVRAFARGVGQACTRWGVDLVGGDTTAGPVTVVTTTVGGPCLAEPLTRWPFGPPAPEFLAWLFYGGGVELAEEMYGRDNIKFHACGMIPPETSGWFREEITSLDQLQGLKMRFFGLGAKVMQKFGVSTQQLAGGDIYPALELGTIDATEFSMPAIDRSYGFYQIAKYNYFPGWHQQSTTNEILINKEKWEGAVGAVSGDLQDRPARPTSPRRSPTAKPRRLRPWPPMSRMA